MCVCVFRTPENWLDHGLIDGVRYPLPGQAFVIINEEFEADDPDNWGWINVAVTNYDFDLKLWAILTLDGLQRQLQMPRVYVMFKAEDPVNFAQRLKDAVDLRYYTENSIRYGLLNSKSFNLLIPSPICLIKDF